MCTLHTYVQYIQCTYNTYVYMYVCIIVIVVFRFAICLFVVCVDDRNNDQPPSYDEVDKTEPLTNDSGAAPDGSVGTETRTQVGEEMETDESQKKEKEGDESKGDADNKESSVDVEDEEKEKGLEEGDPRMFEIQAVNGYGSQTLVRFKDDGSPLKLGGEATNPLCYIRTYVHRYVHTVQFIRRDHPKGT